MIRIAIAFLLTAAVAAFVYFRLESFNHFKIIEEDFAGACSPVTGIAGPEDLQIVPGARRAFVSSFDRRAKSAPGQKVRGAIFAINLDDPLDAGAWRDRTGGAPHAFEPMGLHYYEAGDVRRLFVVNAAAKSVELYDVAPSGDLEHLETFSERRLTSPNDVVAVGPRSFYVSNDLEPGRDTMLGDLHFLAQIGSGSVLYFNGASWRLAADDLRFANGVMVNADGDRFYVAETAGQAIKIFERAPESGLLKLLASTPLGAAPDNINIDDEGALWVGAHPKPLSIVRHQRKASIEAPSQIIKIRNQADTLVIDPVFSTAGSAISAATSAARAGETLVIGALMDEKYLLCRLGA